MGEAPVINNPCAQDFVSTVANRQNLVCIRSLKFAEVSVRIDRQVEVIPLDVRSACSGGRCVRVTAVNCDVVREFNVIYMLTQNIDELIA